MQNKKVVIYARVSSKEQEREGFSIPAQLKLLKEYALKNGFQIVAEYSDNETAKKAGRTNYNIMLDFLKSNQDVKTLLVEKTDRLYRNFKDYVVLEDYDLEVHLVKESTVISKSSRSHDKFIHGIKVLMAKNYIDNLSEEISKGLHEAIEEGFWPFSPPYGYKRGIKKSLYINDVQALFIHEAFMLFATRRYSIRKLAQKLFEDGFYPYKKPCTKSNIEDILKNPIYMGEFNYGGRRYKGVHEPLVSKELYCSVQKRITGEVSPRKTKHEHLYKCLIKCAFTGRILSGETKKGANNSGEYTYYRCTHKDGCKQPCKPLKASFVDEFVEDTIKKLIPTQEQIEFLVNRIKEIHKSKNQYDENAIETIQKEILTLKKRINNAYNDKLDGLITNEFYFEKEEVWQREIDEKEVSKMKHLN